MKKLFNPSFLIFLVPIIFLIVSILTLGDYGINWDSPKHFMRGQAYLHYTLSGKRNFLDLPAYPALKGAPDYIDFNVEGVTNSGIVKERSVKNPSLRRSYYQSDFYTFDYFMTKHIHTHPEVNNLLMAATNYIFYQKLGLLGDIEAYHLFIILVVFALSAAVAVWIYKYFGVFSSIITTSSLLLYPLIFSETHFNVKDPLLMSFFGLAILTFWLGFSNKKALLITLSAIFAGFALGTKFNILFLPFILGPWAIFDMFLHYKKGTSLLSLIGGPRTLVSLLFYPVIMLLVLYIFSPYLWSDPVGHFIEIVNYYKEIGAGTPLEQSKYLVWGWNTYPLVWILYTTPLPVLFLSIVGFFYAMFLFLVKRKEMAFLILLWFTVPILRSMWPGMNIYGGVRQIMEFIPAMAILSGIGALLIIQSLKLKIQNYSLKFKVLKKIQSLLTFNFALLTLVLLLIPAVKLHPNQNVYFNELIGGLKGAKEKNVPSWGNTYGNVYLQGIEWLNKNAEVNAKLALPVNYISSIPRLKLRSDIDLDNHHFSGPKRAGEYAMEMDYDWPLKARYKYAYYDTFLVPTYQVQVDEVSILKIWKNDLEHTRKGFKEEAMVEPQAVKIEDNKIEIDFVNVTSLTKLVIKHSIDNCSNKLGSGFIATSKDGVNFTQEPGPLFDPESPESSPGMDDRTFVFMFAAKPMLSLIYNTQDFNSCILKNSNVTVWGLTKNY